MSWLVALLVSCAVGTAVGYLHGKVTTKFSVPPFIVTLGGMTVWRGATLIINDGAPISGFNAGYRWWGRGDILGVPVPVLVFFVVAARRLRRAALHALRSSGLRRRRQPGSGAPVGRERERRGVQRLRHHRLPDRARRLSAFGPLGSAEAVAGVGYELRVIASVVIGGTSLFGGMGGVGGTVIGALLIGVLINGLVIMNVSAYYQQVIIGSDHRLGRRLRYLRQVARRRKEVGSRA